jgi:hypothetical protein
MPAQFPKTRPKYKADVVYDRALEEGPLISCPSSKDDDIGLLLPVPTGSSRSLPYCNGSGVRLASRYNYQAVSCSARSCSASLSS